MKIMIDVLVPPLDEIFDFEVDAEMDARKLISGVEELVSQKTRCEFSDTRRELFLYRAGNFLKENVSLCKQGVISGDRLILI